MNKTRMSGLGLLTAIALAGCSDTNAPNTDDALDADVAVMAADAAIRDLQSMSDLFGGLFGGPAPMSVDSLTRTRVITPLVSSADAPPLRRTLRLPVMLSITGPSSSPDCRRDTTCDRRGSGRRSRRRRRGTG